MTSTRRASLLPLGLGLVAVITAVGGFSSCSSSNNPSPPTLTPAPQPTADASLPGLNIEVVSVNDGNNVQPGQALTVRFRVTRNDGELFDLQEMDRNAIYVSGPTFNYQRVIASQSDLVDRALLNADGTYSYTFADPMPDAYLAPYNDTGSITVGELTGQALLSGTYSVGIELRKDYEIDGSSYRDPGNVTFDFLVGDAQNLEPREVVGEANCFQCHSEIRVHGENRTDVTGCLLCHTAGAEDKNEPTAAGGTPGVTIDFRVMIHKIHAGKHLPSVLGVTTDTNGDRVYDAAPQPYQVVGFRNSVHDYSEVAFPIWPSAASPMPRDEGYGSLTGDQQGLEDAMRSAPVDCASCHGDPDGDGPAAAPAQGDLIYTQPTTAACASCHDDWIPDHPYTANTETMPPQRDDATCTQCHREQGTSLDIRDAHVHPSTNPAIAAGLELTVTGAVEANGDGDGTFDPGEKIQVTVDIVDANGPADSATLRRMEVVLNGPTTNPNLVHLVRLDTSVLTGPGPSHTFMLPEAIALESVGNSVAGLQSYATRGAPHWTNADTTVFLADTVTATSNATAALTLRQNHVDLVAGGGASFADGDHVALSPGVPASREVVEVAWVDGDRLWFEAGVRNTHLTGALVARIGVTEIPSTDYTLDPMTGVITETTEFGTGEVLVSYTTDFVVPETFPGTLNNSPDLGETAGDWTGLPLLSGTYNLGAYANRSVRFVNPLGNGGDDDTGYVEASQASVVPLLFGDATAIETIDRIDTAATCNACHTDIQFHGGNRRGYASCTLCHTLAGAEDAPRYVYPSAMETTGVTIDFRTMIHKIHHGRELENAATYAVTGFRGTPHTYEHVAFPVMNGGTQDCAKCHGESNTAWQNPAPRNHPLQAFRTGAWQAACNSCHDSDAELAHAQANTAPNGGEACAICHGPGEIEDVVEVHRIR